MNDRFTRAGSPWTRTPPPAESKHRTFRSLPYKATISAGLYRKLVLDFNLPPFKQLDDFLDYFKIGLKDKQGQLETQHLYLLYALFQRDSLSSQNAFTRAELKAVYVNLGYSESQFSTEIEVLEERDLVKVLGGRIYHVSEARLEDVLTTPQVYSDEATTLPAEEDSQSDSSDLDESFLPSVGSPLEMLPHEQEDDFTPLPSPMPSPAPAEDTSFTSGQIMGALNQIYQLLKKMEADQASLSQQMGQLSQRLDALEMTRTPLPATSPELPRVASSDSLASSRNSPTVPRHLRFQARAQTQTQALRHTPGSSAFQPVRSRPGSGRMS